MKRIMALVIACCIFRVVHAQQVSLGPSMDFGHAWVSGLDKINDVKFKPVFTAGIALVYSASEHFGIGADVKASFAEGVKYDATLIGSSYKPRVEENAAYLRVPVKAIYFFNNYGDRMHPKIFAGPSFGYLLGGKIKNTSNNSTATSYTKDYWKSFDVGLTGGAGVNARLAQGTWLNLDLTYYHGLSNVRKNESSPESKNRNVGINVGVAFPLSTQ